MRRGLRRSVLTTTAATVLVAAAACGSPAPRTQPTTSTGGSTTATSAAPTPSTALPPTAAPRPAPTTTRPAPTPGGTTTTPTVPPAPAPTLPDSLRGRVIERIPTTRKVVALTFDAGANAAGAASILRTLREQNVPATFFMTGAFAAANPSVARQMAALGRVGNHTVTHPHLAQASDARIRSEVADATTAIVRAAGETPKPLFRFPFGEYTAHALAVVNGMGYVAVGWTVDSLGWQGTEKGMTAAKVVARVVGARTPGEIVLMHVGSNPDDHTTFDADALPQVISALRSYGYGFVTLAALGV